MYSYVVAVMLVYYSLYYNSYCDVVMLCYVIVIAVIVTSYTVSYSYSYYSYS